MKRFVQWLQPLKIIPTVNVGSWDSRKAMERCFSEWLAGTKAKRWPFRTELGGRLLTAFAQIFFLYLKYCKATGEQPLIDLIQQISQFFCCCCLNSLQFTFQVGWEVVLKCWSMKCTNDLKCIGGGVRPDARACSADLEFCCVETLKATCVAPVITRIVHQDWIIWMCCSLLWPPALFAHTDHLSNTSLPVM